MLDDAGHPVPGLSFAATLDPAESDLTRLDSDQLLAHFGEEAVKSAGAQGEHPPVPLWTWLVLAAAGAFFVEGVLLRK